MMNKPTKLQTAKANLLKVIYCKNNNEEISIENTRERVNYNEVISKINLPSTANSAVDGYGILAETLNENKNIEFQVIGVAKAGHPLNVNIKIKEAVENIFKVKVKSVNTITTKGKLKAFRGTIGRRSNFKKAIVTLQDGQSIDMSAGV